MNNITSTKKITFGGMIVLLSTVMLYLTIIIPTNKITLLVISSFLLSIVVIEAGVSTSIMAYIATSIISFIIMPNKGISILYILLFGHYPIIKYFIERIDKVVLEWIIKILVLNLSLYINYKFFLMIIGNINIDIPLWGIVILLQILIIVYDYIFTMAISYYKNTIRKKLR
ncbi:hypothetical protein CLPU_1c01310 [Gottschalkia purinilytica]|uniref:Uncharacterized protein n=1 Tax=Gottschalkia purinilytica TaxID=1503 RepID=A0A0L0WEW0_GOTPU|nr:hypothetical protein [Gottschalkia purinilytica]KNF09966.1 hypothetical protein CLPU_1c01310 [Gottschalkia purinilytica]